MTDAGKAQHKAVSTTLPSTTILIWWFRVTQTIKRPQSYQTTSGYATTNNTVDQYHRTVKLVNNLASATPIEMFNLSVQSRIGYLAEKRSFYAIKKYSTRLKV
ncbi:hypothetical protein PHMEG_0005565 [Phytophthora megakarya]|uniref:Uncharacterized protein n=1 Tax=Phytophthora megakarya TaxID=4795 RepID=A0A225WR86_9STRA|nr:hypothetical protein PHMEG_0005565 [Phytophthora megakarya]